MKLRLYTKGFSMVEIMIVVAIIAIGAAVSFWSLQGRSNHYKIRGSTREMLQLMKLAQSAAIKNNSQFRIRFLTPTTYDFQIFTASGWAAVPSDGTRLSLANQSLLSGITFNGIVGTMGCAALPCQSPRFNVDGTINPSGSFQITDGQENLSVNWSIGGSIRVQ